MGYLKHTIKGLSWVGTLRVLSRALTFLKTIIVARILLPFQFGVFGIVSLILTFLEILTETGVNVILIQEGNLSQSYINSSWVISIFRGILISLLMILSRGAVASFFRTPEVANLILLASIIPILRGLINPTIIKFQKELRFDKEFRYRLLVFFVETAASLSLVLITRSVAALVWGMIIGAGFEVVLSFFWSKPTPAFSFSKKYFRNLIGRGKWVTFAGIFNYFFSQGDTIAVGRLLNTEFLGLYQMAYKISILPITEVTDVVSKVTLPVYIKICGDLARLKTAFRKTFLGTCLLVIPPSLLFFFFPKEIVTFILGEKWILSAPALKVLALFVPLRAFSSTAVTLFFSLRKQEYVTRVSFFSFLFLAVTVIPLTYKFGIVGAGISVVISSVLVTPLVIYYLFKIFKQE